MPGASPPLPLAASAPAPQQPATARAAGEIKAIDKATVHRICSGQVILDLATAVKELVENALDAGATSIEVRLQEYGGELLEVADNGHGVAPASYQALTLKYHTSKIEEFGDLQELATFGFRGEALSSLCAVADVSVVTRTAEQEVGVRLTYDQNGVLTGQVGAARTVGTTIAVRELFKRLPVRHKEFLRHIKREYARLVALLQAYALISTGVRLICTNQVGNAARTTVVNTQASPSIRDNILNIFGSKAVEGMEPLEVEVEEAGGIVTVVGWVSKATVNSGRTAGDRQFLFLNGRPVDLPKATKALNETYRSLSSPATASCKPMAVVDFRLPKDSYDVNVTPDKRKVFLHGEKKILQAFQEGLQALWEPSRNTYAVADPSQAAPGGCKARASQAVAAGSRTIPSFSQFAAAAGGEEEGGEEAQQASPSRSPPAASGGEPAAKRRAVLPLAAFALGGASQAAVASGPAALQQQQQQQQQQQAGKQRSLFSFGFQRDEAQQGGKEEEQAAAPAAGAATADGEAGQQQQDRHEEQQQQQQQQRTPSATTAVLQTTPLSSAAGGGTQQQQQQQHAAAFIPQPSRTAAGGGGEESEDDGMYELSDDEQLAAAGMAAGAAEGMAAAGAAVPLPAAEGRRPVTQAAARPQLAAEGSQEEEVPAAVTYATSSSGDITAAVDVAGMRQRLLAAARACAAGGSQGAAARQNGRRRFGAASLAGAEPGAAAAQAAGLAGMTREQAEQVAEQELQRVFNKADFRNLEVLGQFNLGFIIARLDRDLFIIDQHASDEKFNFERLQRTTVLNKQPLLAPQRLDLSPTEELTVRDNMEVFRQNGFDFRDEPGTGRLLLSAVPFSKNITFGPADVAELVTLLDGGAAPTFAVGTASLSTDRFTPGAVVRPSRVRAMIASRACRCSIMIGRALHPRTMRLLLDHLADLEQPWNCPHGRPTMRHLALLPPPAPALQS